MKWSGHEPWYRPQSFLPEGKLLDDCSVVGVFVHFYFTLLVFVAGCGYHLSVTRYTRVVLARLWPPGPKVCYILYNIVCYILYNIVCYILYNIVCYILYNIVFRVCKSVHHHTFRWKYVGHGRSSWPNHDQQHCYHHAPTVNQRLLLQLLSSWWWAWGCLKYVELYLNDKY